MTRIACLHGHYTNIPLISEAFAAYDVELTHFVDPGLLLQNSGEATRPQEHSHAKLLDHLSWMHSCSADAIVITCTQYAALLTEEDEAELDSPVFTIDGPFFHQLAQSSAPQVLLFSNPATVTPTMERLTQCARSTGYQPEIEIRIVENAFTLLMENKHEAYKDAVMEGLHLLHQTHPEHYLAVAQLSMVPVANQFSSETGRIVVHPLHSLTSQMVETLHLQTKR